MTCIRELVAPVSQFKVAIKDLGFVQRKVFQPFARQPKLSLRSFKKIRLPNQDKDKNID